MVFFCSPTAFSMHEHWIWPPCRCFAHLNSLRALSFAAWTLRLISFELLCKCTTHTHISIVTEGHTRTLSEGLTFPETECWRFAHCNRKYSEKHLIELLFVDDNGSTHTRRDRERNTRQTVRNHLNEKCAFTSFCSFYTNMDLIFNVRKFHALDFIMVWFHFDAIRLTMLSLSHSLQYSRKNLRTIHLVCYYASARQCCPLNKMLEHDSALRPRWMCNETLPFCGWLYVDELDLIVCFVLQKLCFPFARSALVLSFSSRWDARMTCLFIGCFSLSLWNAHTSARYMPGNRRIITIIY